MKIPFAFLLILEITGLIWALMKSSTLTIEKWLDCTVSFLSCFKGTGFEKESGFFELGIALIGPWVTLRLPLACLVGSVLQKDHQTASTGLRCLLFLFSFPLALHCRDFMQDLSLINHMTEISICQMYQNLPVNCAIILLIGWIWWNVMNVAQRPCVAGSGS